MEIDYSTVVDIQEKDAVCGFPCSPDKERFSLGEEDTEISNVTSEDGVSFLVYFEYNETLLVHSPFQTDVFLGVPINQKSFTRGS